MGKLLKLRKETTAIKSTATLIREKSKELRGEPDIRDITGRTKIIEYDEPKTSSSPRLIKRKKTDVNVEKRIITGMIVSKEYMQSIYPLINFAYFKSSFTKRVAYWCYDFYGAYEEVPFDDIQSIFDKKTAKLKDEEAKLISKLLVRISKRYAQDKGLNLPYLLDETERYFKYRELEITSGNMKVMLEKGDVEGAERQIVECRKIGSIEGTINFEETILTAQNLAEQNISDRKSYLDPWLRESSITLVSGKRGVGKLGY